MKLKVKLLLISLLALTSACIEDYDLTLTPQKKVLIVEGFMTDLPQADTFRVMLSDFVGIAPVDNIGIDGCKVSISVENGQTYNLLAKPQGYYYTPKELKPRAGQQYKLQIQTPNGESYASNFQQLYTTPPIAKASDIFNPKGILNTAGTRTLASNDLYLDVQDPANERNFYLWKYLHYERIQFCKTCEKGILQDTQSNRCITQEIYSPTYDYECLGNCYDIIYSTRVNVFSDANTNGKLIQNRLIGSIPLYSKAQGCLIEIQQYGLSPDGFRYYNVLVQQVQTTGSLADSPPAPIVGNITNINKPREPVVGYFGVSSVKTLRYFIDRKTASASDATIVPILGRNPNPEPLTAFRPPRALCLPSGTRTPVRPEGWPN
jgi:hypothetical protein